MAASRGEGEPQARDLQNEVRKSSPPKTWAELVISCVWNAKCRGPLIVAIIPLGVLAAVWSQLPVSSQEGILRYLSVVFDEKSDVEVGEFKVPEQHKELSRIKARVERNFVDLFVNAGLSVRSELTTNQSIRRTFHRVDGSITPHDGRLLIEAKARNSAGRVIGSAQLDLAEQQADALYKVIPESLIYGMNLDARTFKTHNAASRPTSSNEAYAFYARARLDAQSRNLDRARTNLLTAVHIDPNFAMAYWTLGEVERIAGRLEEEQDWKQRAQQVNIDHARWPLIQERDDIRPVPHLQTGLRATQVRVPDEGIDYRLVVAAEYGIALHAWTFQRSDYDIRIVQQTSLKGHPVRDFLRGTADVMALNGGFFDVDTQHNLSPSGYLVIGGAQVNAITQAGSGILYARGSEVAVAHRSSTFPPQINYALQSGPILVEQGGKMGMRRDDRERQRRSAFCLRGEEFTTVVADGGLSLFELAQLLVAKAADGGFECDVALNLDGGPSTAAYFKAGTQETSVEGRWRVHHALVVSRRERNLRSPTTQTRPLSDLSRVTHQRVLDQQPR